MIQHCQSIEVSLSQPTDDLRVITHQAKKRLAQIFREGCCYKKTGICFDDLLPKASRQLDLFLQTSDDVVQKTEDLMSILDKINQRFGRHTLHLAAEGRNKPWDAAYKCDHLVILPSGLNWLAYAMALRVAGKYSLPARCIYFAALLLGFQNAMCAPVGSIIIANCPISPAAVTPFTSVAPCFFAFSKVS